jgi:3-hydroxyisobutyrate dehydrogenase-like beta-hydroxyacid dehydrogenase
MIIGLLHPGEMGAAIGSAWVQAGQQVLWLPSGRSPATAARAAAAGMTGVEGTRGLVAESDLVVSVCPPDAALEVAALVAAAAPAAERWMYLDANAVAPATAESIARTVGEAGGVYVDGGIIGPPPTSPGTTRLYLSGPGAIDVSEMIGTPAIEIHVVSEKAGDASALKLAYSAWTKGSNALLLAARAAAARLGIEEALLLEWRTSIPDLIDRVEGAERAARQKAWRWSGEMDEIAAMFDSVGLPSGFHRAAGDVYRHLPF